MTSSSFVSTSPLLYALGSKVPEEHAVGSNPPACPGTHSISLACRDLTCRIVHRYTHKHSCVAEYNLRCPRGRSGTHSDADGAGKRHRRKIPRPLTACPKRDWPFWTRLFSNILTGMRNTSSWTGGPRLSSSRDLWASITIAMRSHSSTRTRPRYMVWGILLCFGIAGLVPVNYAQTDQVDLLISQLKTWMWTRAITPPKHWASSRTPAQSPLCSLR